MVDLRLRRLRKIPQIEERLETLEEAIEVLADRKLLRQVRRALDDIRKGRYKDYDDVEEFKAEFESKAEIAEGQILLMHGEKYDDKGSKHLANHSIGQMKGGVPKLIWPFDKATTQPNVPFPSWEGR